MARADEGLGVRGELPQEDKLVIYDGASIRQLSEMFHMTTDKVRKLIRKVKPAGKRNGSEIYPIKEAAAYLVEPVIDEETFVRLITRTQDLPPYLQKEFWAAKTLRQKYEVEAGDLWPTDDVIAVLAEVFKKLKTGIQLFADATEARTELTREQRAVITELSDGLCIEMRRILVEGEYEREQKSEREKVISDAD